MERSGAFVAIVFVASAIGGCSPDNSGGHNNSTGGVTTTGGAATSGGAATNGGSSSMGGAVAAGGGTGGSGVGAGGTAPASGGTSTGGASSAGSGGGPAGGGGVSAGGTVATGGSGGASGGAGGSGGASGGAGGSLTLTMPIQRSGKYVLEFGNVLFEVDPAVGGRVVTFSLSGKNLLTGASADTSNQSLYGSTFWPSPQTSASWGGSTWPPIPEVDSQAYTATLDGTSIVMTQQTTSVRGKVSVTKRFTAVLDAQAVDVQYTLTNKDTSAVSRAPWEITRVPLSGITFFPTGTAVVPIVSPTVALNTSRVTTSGGVSWYQNQPCTGYDSAKNTCTSGDIGKYIADGSEGWVGQVSGSVLFIKRFADITAAQAAPGEADFEFYAGPGYEEVEPQGAYQELQPGASLTWTVRWYIRQLSDTSIATVGNAALVALARDTIKQ